MGLDLSMMRNYEPRWLGVLELKLGDEWRAKWVAEGALPPDAPVIYAYAAVYMGDKGYVTRRAGDDRWGVVEGPLGTGEKPTAWVKRASQAQVGATLARVELIGYLECKATSHNPDFPAGTTTLRPVYLVVAKQVKNLPADSGYERRRLPLNEHATAIRARYPELDQYLLQTLDRFAVLRATGAA
ncbi:MAG: hypothetical protein IT304_06075 [Dehalococcoidia bacterium]|nr:hypothetical protein [Dehalococcoidia bacterium]